MSNLGATPAQTITAMATSYKAEDHLGKGVQGIDRSVHYGSLLIQDRIELAKDEQRMYIGYLAATKDIEYRPKPTGGKFIVLESYSIDLIAGVGTPDDYLGFLDWVANVEDWLNLYNFNAPHVDPLGPLEWTAQDLEISGYSAIRIVFLMRSVRQGRNRAPDSPHKDPKGPIKYVVANLDETDYDGETHRNVEVIYDNR